MTIHVHKKFRRALSFANNIRLAEPNMKPGIECIRKKVSRKTIFHHAGFYNDKEMWTEFIIDQHINNPRNSYSILVGKLL